MIYNLFLYSDELASAAVDGLCAPVKVWTPLCGEGGAHTPQTSMETDQHPHTAFTSNLFYRRLC